MIRMHAPMFALAAALVAGGAPAALAQGQTDATQAEQPQETAIPGEQSEDAAIPAEESEAAQPEQQEAVLPAEESDAAQPEPAQETAIPAEESDAAQTEPTQEAAVPAGQTQSQQSWQMGAQTQQELSRADRKFIEEAAEGNHAEIQLGKLASEKSQNQMVKQLGQALEQDHQQAQQQLEQLAQTAGVEVPTKPGDKAMEDYRKLQDMSGQEFDRKFAEMALKDHKRDLESYNKQVQEGSHIGLRQYAAETVPFLSKHYVMAEQIQKSLKERPSS